MTKNILVIGESCRDIFVYCKAERLAPDLPIPVLGVMEQRENPGMAANVHRNIAAIHPMVDLVTNPNWREVTKTRFMHHASNHAFVRVDAESRVPRIIFKKVPLAAYDIIAISDYNKGYLHEDDIAAICAKHPCVFIDTKKVLGGWAQGAKYIKINDYEYERSKHALTPEFDQKIIVTRGGRGAVYRNKEFLVKKVEVKDSTGAGDTFFAALVVKFAETGNIEKAIRFANTRAGEVVKHRGVTVMGNTSGQAQKHAAKKEKKSAAASA